jgi:hypothetical protein
LRHLQLADLENKETKQTSVLVSKLSKLRVPHVNWAEENLITSKAWVPSSYNWSHYLNGYQKELEFNFTENLTVSFQFYFPHLNVDATDDLGKTLMVDDISRIFNIQESFCE